MTKEIMVTLSGAQEILNNEFDQGEVKQSLETSLDDEIQVIAIGEYYEKNGTHYILYDEVIEGASISDKNMIKIGPDRVEVTKKGASSALMVFEEGKKSVTNYQTPYGEIFMGIDVFRIEKRIEESLITLFIHYQLALNYEPVAMCSLRLKVTPREDKNFTLQ